MVVVCSHFVSHFELSVEYLHFGQENGCLYRVKTTVYAEPDVIVTFFLAMSRDLSNSLSEAIIVSEDCTTVAVTTKRFAREETRAGNLAETA